MPVALAVALFGGVGAMTRYLVDRLIEQHAESVFPWSTFAINISGCLIFGIVTASLVDRHHLPAWLRVGLVVGFIGGYTTFSTFAAETLGLTNTREALVALTYTITSVSVGVAAVFTGTRLGTHL